MNNFPLMIDFSQQKTIPANISEKLLRQSMHRSLIIHFVSAKFVHVCDINSQELLMYVS